MTDDVWIPAQAPCLLDLGDLILLKRSGLFDIPWFLQRNPDLAAAGLDPMTHFHRYGWREGRWPNAYFDPAWYVREYQDVAARDTDPLLHYVLYGEAEGRQPVPHFDPRWYRDAYNIPSNILCLQHFLQHRHEGTVSPVPEFDPQYYLQHAPDVAAAGMDPFEHYLVTGAAEGRPPSADFDPVFYRRTYLRDRPNANPLLHYRQHRNEPGMRTRPGAQDQANIPQEVRRNTQPGPMFEDRVPLDPAAPRRAKLLAFYLPQFHPVPENDRWWGTGFTEWTNVSRGVPRFAGHYQPRIPRDLGHYRLEGTETLRRQIALAREGGVHGFVFYFYWFNGRRLLEAPLESFLADRSLDMPFCLMWANENWTRRWDGSEHEVLLSQDYRAEDEAALTRTFARHFEDPRYIKLGGRPVLMVYRASLIPNTAAAVARWRRGFRALGHDPLFIMGQSFGDRDPRPFGMDAAFEFPPHKLTDSIPLLNPQLEMLDQEATARVYAYDDLAAASDLAPPPYPLIRTAVPGWDNDARRQGAGMTVHGATPAAYQAWLSRLIDAAVDQPVHGEALVCVNAWNEWAEGAYLEPDMHFGAAFLNATARAVAGPAAASAGEKLLLVGHDAFPAGAQLLLLHLGRYLREVRGVDVAFLLGAGGALEPEYRAVASTTVLTGTDDLPRHVRALAARGFTSAVVNSSAAAAIGAELGKAGVAYTLLVHELPRLLRERGLVEGARAGAEAAQHVVFAAPYVRDRFQELVAVSEDRALLLPQGLYRPVDQARAAAKRAELGLSAEVTLAIGIGYADLRKGFDLFLQAWRLARAADPAIHFLWVGDLDPAVSAYLGAEMAAAAATGTFHHLPFQPDGADWLAAADVHLQTSREDPFPSVVLEAMSAGVPTVAFEEAGGAPDLLRDLRAGASVPLGDAAAMVRHLRVIALQTTKEERARLARAVRKQFSFAAYADRLLELTLPRTGRVTAVVPNYNYAHYLPGRLESIFGQTIQPTEIIVLDDASTDGSERVVRQEATRAGRDVRWAGSAVNSGSVFAQWRRAAQMAETEFVWIAEADDGAEPELLERLLQAMQAAPDARFGFADSRAVDAAGATLWPNHQDYYRDSGTSLLARSGTIPAELFLRECLGTRNLVLNASAVLWRRDALLEALERSATLLGDFRLAGDWLIYAQALAAGGSVAYVAEPLNLHRRHGAGVTHGLPPVRHLDEIKRMHRQMRALLDNPPGLQAEQRRALSAVRRVLQD
ncbi:MAG: glycoside hydrolase family 99-like domain-containing protein [Acetobacteraceae bacterium]|nr:glycoside hydrolase family 99-like domain-containing protein [Acetobacteraceae bacterium]